MAAANISTAQARSWGLSPTNEERDVQGRPGIASRLALALAGGVLLIGIALMGLRVVGFEFISIRGESMEPTFSPGSLLLARTASPEEISPGDIISFKGTSPAEPSVVHRVVSIESAGHILSARTMGDNNPVPDPGALILDHPMSRVVWIVPHLGWAITPVAGWLLLAVSASLTVLFTARSLVQGAAAHRPAVAAY